MVVLRRSRSAGARALTLLLGAAPCGCVPDIDDDPSLVSSERVLAVIAEPPEAREGDRVALSALVAGSRGASGASVSYSFCLTRKPLSELGPVDPSCLSGSGELIALGQGSRVEGMVDRGACSLFGPRRPSPEPGQPAGRPVDPDPTGGFYQPVLASLPEQPAVLGGVRLDCGLPGADRDQVIEYNLRHRPNQNPAVERLELLDAAGWSALDPEATHPIAAGQRLVLRVSWPSCADDGPCAGAETYVLPVPASRALLERSEEVLASWYASGGGFDAPRTGSVELTSPHAENTWNAPLQPGPASVWVVLRDGRGGVGHAHYRFEMQ